MFLCCSGSYSWPVSSCTSREKEFPSTFSSAPLSHLLDINRFFYKCLISDIFLQCFQAIDWNTGNPFSFQWPNARSLQVSCLLIWEHVKERKGKDQQSKELVLQHPWPSIGRKVRLSLFEFICEWMSRNTDRKIKNTSYSFDGLYTISTHPFNSLQSAEDSVDSLINCAGFIFAYTILPSWPRPWFFKLALSPFIKWENVLANMKVLVHALFLHLRA